MTTTRRLSSLQGQGQSHQQTSLLLDSYETFKRKHIQQNKEIISKNSELNKEKADLQSQISLMRVERLSLMSSNLKLNIQLEAVRKRLERALEREHDLVRERDRLKKQQHHHVNHGIDPKQVELMQQALVNAIAALQAFGLALPATALSSSSLRSSTSGKTPSSQLPSSPPASPPSTSSPGFDLEPEPSTSATSSRRASLAERGPRESICVSPPDLSNIDEADASDEERDDYEQRQQQEEEEERRQTAWEGQRFEPILQQLPLLARAPSPPRMIAPPTPSTSATPAIHTATPLARPASRGPRAPPKAPSASSHSTLGNASTGIKRPARRVSGMLRPRSVVEFGEDDGGVEEEESAGPVDRTDVSDDSADEGSGSVAEPLAAPPTATTSRSRRRVSSIGLDAAPTPSLFSARTRVTRSTSPAAEDVTPRAEETALVPRSTAAEPIRPALRETQPKASSSSSSSSSPNPITAASATQPPTAKEKIVERMKRRTTRVPVAAADVEAQAEAAQQERSAAVLASLSRTAKTGRRQVDDEVDAEVAEEEEEDDAEEECDVRAVDEQQVGAESEEVRSNAQHESEDAQAAAEVAEEEAAAGGRRARKSVNYALPKLNTKMRRPEDYVPVKPGASKPRKSSRPTSTAPRTSELPPPMPATTAMEPVPAPAPTPRPASLAGKKPPPDSLVKPGHVEDSAMRSQISAARGTAPNPSTSTIRQDLEARRKQRQAERDQLAKLGSSGGDLANRRQVAAAI